MKPDSLILKKIHPEDKMHICACLYLCLFHSIRVLPGCWQLTGQILAVGEVHPLVLLFIQEFLISASSQINIHIVCNLGILSLYRDPLLHIFFLQPYSSHLRRDYLKLLLLIKRYICTVYVISSQSCVYACSFD